MAGEREIGWLDDIGQARKKAEETGKPILLYFHYKHCTGCKNTFERTLPKMSVIDAITENFVPVLLETSERPNDAATYSVDWTPTFIVADDTGLEITRWVGFLPEDDFLAQLTMTRARAAMREHEYKNAERIFGEMIIKFPLTDLAAEAVYYRGVAKYKDTMNAEWLTRSYENLKEGYPESTWALKASVWSREKMEKAA